MLKSTSTENDFVSEPPETLNDPSQFKVGDKVTFGMPWMGGRLVSVSAIILDIEPPNALLETIAFFEAPGETCIEPLAHLYPWTAEDQENLDGFDETTPEGQAKLNEPIYEPKEPK